MKKLIFLIATICLIGCSADHTYKYYDFKASSLDAESGIIKVGLVGEFVLVDPSIKMKITHKGSPYEFWVWFQTDKKEIQTIKLSNIQLSYEDGTVVQQHSGGTIDLNWSEYRKIYTGGWHFGGLKIEHKPVQVSLETSIETKKWTKNKSFTFVLETEYKEEHENDFWSMLISV